MADKKYVSGYDTNYLDMCYPPIIQSGGSYALKFSAESDKNTLHFGAIICSLGAKYKHYCSNITRTLFVNPSDELKVKINHFNLAGLNYIFFRNCTILWLICKKKC